MDERIVQPRYSIVIRWSDVDQTYIARLPEWEKAGYFTPVEGRNHREAVGHARKMLRCLMLRYPEDKWPAPDTEDLHPDD